ncbi:MAG: Ig-like domain-containing protein [Thermoplasmatota archaeon]
MQINLKVIIAILVAIIIVTSGISIYFLMDPEEREPLEITDVTGNVSAKQGDIVTISVNFSDDKQVSSAVIYYRRESETKWENASIIGGSYDINIPRNILENWQYYIVVYDKAGTGPIGNPSIDGNIYYTITVAMADDEQIVHTVFIEKATATDCRYCPYAADRLHQLFTSGNYRFYYVNMVEDKNEIAKTRVNNDYNNYGNPTSYIDGGYKVLMGGLHSLSEYGNAIRAAELRNVPQIKINVTATYDEITDSFTTTIVMTNYEENSYTGQIRVYLTEKISRWNDYNGSKYRYGFLDFIINQQITLAARDITEISRSYDSTDLDPENLMIMAVLFSSQKQQGYANPPDQNPFDAYYADACDATEVIEGGDLPPETGIISPKKGKIYFGGNILGQKIFPDYGLKNTFLFGKIIITAYATADSGIEKVELYIDGELYEELEEEPYQWSFRTTKGRLKHLFLRQHTIEVIAYSNSGKNSTDSMIVWGRF